MVRGIGSSQGRPILDQRAQSAEDSTPRDIGVSYLLDINACIALINEKPPAVRTRLQKALSEGARVMVSRVVAFELWYGVAKSARPEANTRSVETFFAGPISLLDFEPEDARVAGRVRAAL